MALGLGGLPTKQQLAGMGPVDSVPDPAAELKKAVAMRDGLIQNIREEMDLAALSKNPAFLRLVNDGRQKALADLVNCENLSREGPALQANVLAFTEMGNKVQKAAENLAHHQHELAKLQAQLEKSEEGA